VAAQIRAAGGVVHRRSEDGELQVLLIHRPRYGDWTLPKGKCNEGESDELCALREVEEETGLRCSLDRRLGETRYRVTNGAKVVRYFTMSPEGGDFRPHDEVDEVRWLPLVEAKRKVAYDGDLEMLRLLEAESL
jgi:8-oxo-dGTP pyrophosphatase MutT (NUDIX family)